VNPYLVSFADGSRAWRLTGLRLRRQAESSGYFEKVLIYNKSKLDNDHQKFFATSEFSRGFGYWRWKPFVVLKVLKQLPAEVPGLWYVDAGCSVFSTDKAKQKMKEIQQFADENKTGAFFELSESFPEFAYSKKRAIEYFVLNEKQLRSGQVQATAFYLANTDNARQLISKWALLASQSSLFDDSEDIPLIPKLAYVGHRHDQSVLSLLIKNEMLPTLPDILNIPRADLLTQIAAGDVSSPIVATRHKSYFNSLSMSPGPRLVRWIQQKFP
jgi:hypothetical protein